MAEVKTKKSWFRKHWIITGILIIVVIGIIAGISNSGNKGDSENQKNILPKTSGYSIDDCLNACEKYCIQAQTDVCQGSCQTVGKEGSAMDKTVNTIKNVTANLKC